MTGNRPIPERGQYYRHFKGNLYQILGVTTPGRCLHQRSPLFSCVHTETGVWHDVMPSSTPGDTRLWLWPEVAEPHVLYRTVNGDEKAWARPLDIFLEVLGVLGNTQWYRFQRMSRCALG